MKSNNKLNKFNKKKFQLKKKKLRLRKKNNMNIKHIYDIFDDDYFVNDDDGVTVNDDDIVNKDIIKIKISYPSHINMTKIIVKLY